ncbi:hypothetical protein EDD99_4134 [Streptomyces sp. 846.5]|nr:hypothetical protein [Streptomyces sp. 846.5]TDU05609.1 hypothetical protein EDD99_4134 [Streptomyces sp. 846.5]
MDTQDTVEPVAVAPDPSNGFRAGAEAAQALSSALERIGLAFPSLSGDEPCNGRPMVRLGGANAYVVIALARWIEEHQ